ncbi:CorA family divalent cation transporter [Streptomyces sp. NPDC020800]|uniref:CorA family divalent cation transporter n=1 Tax=Streptomyces sp. NPDC020800 TaxID=3365092 RepID=UPI00378F4075
MKKVTSWAAITAVPTVITGYYGQNLPCPGFGRESGCVTSAAVIVVLSAPLYATFKREDWLRPARCQAPVTRFRRQGNTWSTPAFGPTGGVV